MKFIISVSASLTKSSPVKSNANLSIGQQYENAVSEFNTKLIEACKKLTINGERITTFDNDSHTLSIKFNQSGTPFEVYFSAYEFNPASVIIQIASPSKRGTIEKKATGKNVDPVNLIGIINTLFKGNLRGFR